MAWWLAALNTLVALVTGAAGLVALIKPAAIAPRNTAMPTNAFFPGLYAARAVPMAIAVIIVVWCLPDNASAATIVLAVAAAAQLGDVLIAVAQRVPGLLIGAAVVAAVHGLSIFTLWWSP